MFHNFTELALQTVFWARYEAGNAGCSAVDTEHFLIALLRVDPQSVQAAGANLTLAAARERASVWHKSERRIATNVDMPLSEDAKSALEHADSIALGNHMKARTEHLLLALIQDASSHAGVLLREAGGQPEKAEALAASVDPDGTQPGRAANWDDLT